MREITHSSFHQTIGWLACLVQAYGRACSQVTEEQAR